MPSSCEYLNRFCMDIILKTNEVIKSYLDFTGVNRGIVRGVNKRAEVNVLKQDCWLR